MPVCETKEELELSKMSLEEKFKAAVKVIHSLPKDGPYQPSNGTKLKFYGLFKQATEGPCSTSKPGFWDVVGKYKWEAWNNLGQMGKDEAMTEYVEMLKGIVETMSWDGNVQEFLNSIGPFYEFVNMNKDEKLHHVKEIVERLTSSSENSLSEGSNTSTSSSSNSSLTNSPEKKKPEFEEDSSTSGITVVEGEKVEVHVEAGRATYEMTLAPSSPRGGLTNGYGHGHPHYPEPPPTPQHTYSRKSSLIHENVIREDEEDAEEIGMTVTSPAKLTNGGIGMSASSSSLCKEDLEEDTISLQQYKGHTAATSGTEESEKFYSGDDNSDEEDDRFGASFAKGLGAGPSCSSSLQAQDISPVQGPGKVQVQKSAAKNGRKKTFPKLNSTCNAGLNVLLPAAAVMPQGSDLILSQTVDRLNRDVDHILARLRILETAYSNTSASSSSTSSLSRRFFGSSLTYPAIFFIITWPFAVHFILKLIRWWWSRRRRVMSMRR